MEAEYRKEANPLSFSASFIFGSYGMCMSIDRRYEFAQKGGIHAKAYDFLAQ
jgi:hypothetical protein